MKFKEARTQMFLLIMFSLCAVTFGLLNQFTDVKIFLILAYISLIYPLFVVVLGIIFAWIINPIRALKKILKERKK